MDAAIARGDLPKGLAKFKATLQAKSPWLGFLLRLKVISGCRPTGSSPLVQSSEMLR